MEYLRAIPYTPANGLHTFYKRPRGDTRNPPNQMPCSTSGMPSPAPEKDRIHRRGCEEGFVRICRDMFLGVTYRDCSMLEYT